MIAILQKEADSWLDTLPEELYAKNKHGKMISDNAETVLMKYREKYDEKQSRLAAFESQIAHMKYRKSLRHRNEIDEIFDPEDLMFPDAFPNTKYREEIKNDPNWHPELKKGLYSGMPES